ncbi:MFS transporter [Actinomyces naeslundii]|uniref:peptide MFS transporter n=1 Tax=Actinomyces naeslundii TaxID=1655 RepID=UPI00096D8DC6|nr:oligopeptide:H+ symporter [Actinomyces naeslundii]OMG12461.1 MFS transporter [Actinomyces naeslundii]
MAQSTSDPISSPTSGPATTVNDLEDDDLAQPGRLISSRWRPRSLRTTPSREDRGLFGHPRGLPWMLNVEMWERFSYYGMRAILLYFITDTMAHGGLGLSDTSGQVVIALYGMAVYLLAIPGGIFADRVIGPWLSTLYGGVVIMAGHICLTIPTTVTSWTGIVLVAVGTGFIKPNLTTIVGGLYDDDDIRRDAGFQLFYTSINVGAFASPLLTGWLREHYGYHAGFSSAAVGMAFALAAFVYGRHKLSAFAFTVPNPIRPEERRRLLLGSLGVLVAIGVVVAVLQVLTGNLVTTVATAGLLVPVGTAVAYFVVMFRSPKVTVPERTHLRAYIPLWIGAVLFFMITEQAAGKMATFAESNTDLRLPFFGWSTTAEAYQSVNPAAIVLLAPLIGILFTRRAGKFPSTIMKFVIAVLIVGLSALMLGYGFQIWPGGQDLSPWWFLVLVYVIQTVAELFLTPVGLATTTALAPRSFASQAMGLWWLSVAAGQGVAGFVIAQTEHLSDATYYYGLGVATLLMALVLFAVAPWTQRQMADVETATAE